MTQSNLPPELQALAQHYAQAPGAGVGAAPQPQAPAAPPVAYPPAPPAPGPALAAVTPAPGYYRASDGRDYPVPQHLAQQPGSYRPETTYAPPQATQPTPPAPAANPYAGAPVGPLAPPTNPHAPPPEVVPALIANQTQQPLPINPPEVVAALDPNAPPPVERPRRQRKAKAAAVAEAVVADAAPEPSLHTATVDELVDELAFRGYEVTLRRPLGGGR